MKYVYLELIGVGLEASVRMNRCLELIGVGLEASVRMDKRTGANADNLIMIMMFT
jgi:hypothetical protein